MKQPTDKTFICKACGQPGLTKETKHYIVTKINGQRKRTYINCEWDVPYFEETGRLKRESLNV